MENANNAPKNLAEQKEQLKAKIDAFAVEELETRLEMSQWGIIINGACESPAEIDDVEVDR